MKNNYIFIYSRDSVIYRKKSQELEDENCALAKGKIYAWQDGSGEKMEILLMQEMQPTIEVLTYGLSSKGIQGNVKSPYV